MVDSARLSTPSSRFFFRGRSEASNREAKAGANCDVGILHKVSIQFFVRRMVSKGALPREGLSVVRSGGR